MDNKNTTTTTEPNIGPRQMAFLSVARACARVRGKSRFKLNDTDISVVYEVAKAQPHGLSVNDIRDLVSEREATWVFRAVQRMQDAGVLARTEKTNPETKRRISVFVLGPNAESHINFWADVFESAADL